jgi:hypothetical protein
MYEKLCTHLSCCIYQCFPLNLGHESFQKFGIENCFPDFELDVVELEGEVVRVAVFCMARQEVVGDESDHGCARTESRSRKTMINNGQQFLSSTISFIENATTFALNT